MRVAPKGDPDSAVYRPLRVYYSYEKAKDLAVAFPDRIRVFLRIREEQLVEAPKDLMAEVKLTDLSNSEKTHVKWCSVSLNAQSQQNETIGTFDVTNEEGESLIKPEKVYRLFVNLHRKSKQYGQESVWGRVPGPYYVATSGDSLLQRARQQIAMRTFREWYCTERGWPRDGNYRMDCHAYYLWATGFCTVGARYGQANLGALVRRADALSRRRGHPRADERGADPRRLCADPRTHVHAAGVRREPRTRLDDGREFWPLDRDRDPLGRFRLAGGALGRGAYPLGCFWPRSRGQQGETLVRQESHPQPAIE